MTLIIHWDRCSNFQVTDDCEKNCSHHKVNPKIMGHTESGYLFFGGAALWVYQLSKIVQIYSHPLANDTLKCLKLVLISRTLFLGTKII
jgi:hypothetical protein